MDQRLILGACSTLATPIVQLWALRMLVPLGGGEAQWLRGSRLVRLESCLGITTRMDEDGALIDKHLLQAALLRRYREVESLHREASVSCDLRQNVERLAARVGLSAVDQRVLEFATLLHTEPFLKDIGDVLGDLSSRKVATALAHVLDISESEAGASLSVRGPLARSGLVTLARDGRAALSRKLEVLSTRFADKLVHSESDPIQLVRDMVCASAPGHLTLADFAHVQPTLAVLQPYLATVLATGRPGVNVLVHGVSGVGKNQLVKALAQALAVELFEVSSEDEDGDPIDSGARLRAYRAGQSFFGRQGALILFDEVEDVFQGDDGGSATRHDAELRKAWINRMLEGNPVPAFWLTNDVDCMDAAFIRRFDVVLELPVPPRQQREKIIRVACGELLDESTTERLAACQTLAPAVLTRAAAVVRTVHAMLPDGQTAQAVHQLVRSTLRAQGHGATLHPPTLELPAFYDPRFVNVAGDLHAIAAGLRRSGAGRLCLYGPPGTGKTAFAQWLARELERPARVVRASDLMSKWVGGNEKNIARVFREADDDGAVLIIDEVDSFLRDRREARSHWEVTLVNEMLTQMEGFGGVFVASTNRMDSFDPAALRRFDIKLHFDTLKPEQALALCAQHCSALGLPAPDASIASRLAQLQRLTPGDFIAVARQHRFSPFDGVAKLVAALESECALKPPRQRTMGFVH